MRDSQPQSPSAAPDHRRKNSKYRRVRGRKHSPLVAVNGQQADQKATGLPITADGGVSNGFGVRL